MKIITTIVITQEVDDMFKEQVERNFGRNPTFGGTDISIKKNLQRLIPILKDEDINVLFKLDDTK